jgi:hypothetical protein
VHGGAGAGPHPRQGLEHLVSNATSKHDLAVYLCVFSRPPYVPWMHARILRDYMVEHRRERAAALLTGTILLKHQFAYRPSNAITGEGVNDGIEWMCNNINIAPRK